MKLFSLSSSTTFLFLSYSFSLVFCMSRSPEPEYPYPPASSSSPFSAPAIATSSVPFSRDDSQSRSSSERKSKLFPYFLIQFPNDHCTTKDGGGGVCVSQKECRAAGGVTAGTCAQGFGACCRFTKSCGKDGGDIQVRENSTEIRSGNGFSACRFVLPKGRNICQVRLDFVEFQYGSGLVTGECSDSKVVISGGVGNGPMNLCGNLKGQHLYLNYELAERLYITTSDPTSENDKFTVRVSYLRCNSREAVPTHCAQVFTESQGQIRSFNWPQQQLNNQEYTICIDPSSSSSTSTTLNDVSSVTGRKYSARNEGRFLSTFQQNQRRRIEWSTCGNNPADFFISGNKSDSPVTNPEDCDGDYVQIFGGNRQCGNAFKNESITSSPYLLRVRFDGSEMMGKLGEQVMHVSKPGEGCESLNTEETMCAEVAGVEDKKVCKCIRARINSRRKTRTDFGNTGFCLAYKVVN